MRTRILILASILFIASLVVLAIVLSFGGNTSESIDVKILNDEDLPVVVLREGSAPETFADGDFSLVATGEAVVFVNSSGIKSQRYVLKDTESIEVSFSSAKQNVEPESLDVVSESISGNETKFKDLKSYSGGKWVIASAITPGEVSDGEVGIYRVVEGAYEAVFIGTGPDVESLVFEGIPEEIAEKMLEDLNEIN